MKETGDARIDEIMPSLYPFWPTLNFEECIFPADGGYTKLKTKDINKTGLIPVIDQGESFISGYVDDHDKKYSGALPVLIFGDHTRRVKFIDFEFAVGADGTKILHPQDFIFPRFFYYYLRTLNIESQGYSRHYRFLKEISVPLPPLNEQRRIVAKLDELLSRVDACQQRLARIPVILKRFRQAVLATACSGRLTVDWREKQGIGEGDELPEGWKVTSLRDICFGFQYGTSSKSLKSGDVPVLRMGNLQSGKIDWTDLAYTSDKDEIKKYQLVKGDVLFNRTNSPELVGKTSIYLGEYPAIFAGYLIRVKNKPELDSNYLNYCLNSSFAKEWCQQVKTDGVSQSNINAQKLAAFEIPLPTLPEQQEIVRRVEGLFKLADQLEARYTTAQAQIDKLTQSILAKAFRGELVPQDPNDEPAEKLLERIRQQREAATHPRKKKASPSPVLQHTPTAEPPAATLLDLSKTARKILRHMKKGHTYAKHEITTAAILSTSEWNSAIRELKEAGLVLQTGDKRGASYSKI